LYRFLIPNALPPIRAALPLHASRDLTPRLALDAFASPLVGAQAPAERSDADSGCKPLRRASCAAGRPHDAAEGAVSVCRRAVLASMFVAPILQWVRDRAPPARALQKWSGPRLRTCSIAPLDYRDMFEKVRPLCQFARGRREVGLQARRGGRLLLLARQGLLSARANRWGYKPGVAPYVVSSSIGRVRLALLS
jgi:hypothetical protein